MNAKDITIIIPLHEFSSEVKEMLTSALKTVPSEYKVVISTSEKVMGKVEGLDEFNNVTFITKSKSKVVDFASLVNFAVESIDTKWFSILEYDDVYTDIWFRNVEKYMEFYPENSVFLPLTDLVEWGENKFVGYGNEAPWASSFSNEIGYIDNECLQDFFDFYMTGGVYNTEDWKNVGGLKPSIKLTFWYEFLLRLTQKGKKVMVVPKVGYIHIVNRPNSIYMSYKENMTQEESAWWFNLAKQECFFKEDRKKTYGEENKTEKEEGE